jgi:hypothetical protein
MESDGGSKVEMRHMLGSLMRSDRARGDQVPFDITEMRLEVCVNTEWGGVSDVLYWGRAGDASHLNPMFESRYRKLFGGWKIGGIESD